MPLVLSFVKGIFSSYIPHKQKIGLWVVGLLPVLLTGCGSGERESSGAKQDASAEYQLLENKVGLFFELQDLQVASMAQQLGVSGIRIKVKAKALGRNLPESLGADCFGFFLRMEKGRGQTVSLREAGEENPEIFLERSILLPLRSGTLDYFIPYYLLDLESGEQELVFKIVAQPAQFPDREGSNHSRPDSPPGPIGSPDATLEFKLKLNFPISKPFRLAVQEIILDTAQLDPSASDTHIPGLGTGYPDPEWKVLLGGVLLYHSPHLRNTLVYKQKYQTPTLFATVNDQLEIQVVDYDTFVRDDVLAFWKGDWQSISTDPDRPTVLSFGPVKRLVVYRLDGTEP